MSVKVGINGFGRIGRNIFRTALGDSDIDFVAVNDITDTKTLAHLLKYDSVLGNLDHDIKVSGNGISVEGEEFHVFSERDPASIPWGLVGAEIVIESTGRFTKAEDAKKHLHDGVKKVIISAPAKNEDITIVLGVNELVVATIKTIAFFKVLAERLRPWCGQNTLAALVFRHVGVVAETVPELLRHKRNERMHQAQRVRENEIDHRHGVRLLRGILSEKDRLAGFEIPIAKLAPEEAINC